MLLTATGLVGCAADLGQAEVFGSMTVADCKDGKDAEWTCAAPAAATCDAFEIDADHLSLETFGDRAVVRLQHGGRPLAQADALVFDIREVGAIEAQLGEPIALTDDGPVRGTMALYDRCPDSAASFRLDGAVVFEAFGTGIGDRVAGRFDAVTVVDRRHPDAPPLGTLSGNFDFDVVKGTIHQRFVDL